jgi:chromosome segregation ATPase
VDRHKARLQGWEEEQAAHKCEVARLHADALQCAKIRQELAEGFDLQKHWLHDLEEENAKLRARAAEVDQRLEAVLKAGLASEQRVAQLVKEVAHWQRHAEALDTVRDREAVRTRELECKTAALVESEHLVASLSENLTCVRERVAAMEDRVAREHNLHVAEVDKLHASLCTARLTSQRAREDLLQLALAVGQQVDEFLLHVGALPNCSGLTSLTSLLTRAVAIQQQALGGQLAEFSLADDDRREFIEANRCAAEGGGGKD